MFYPEDNQDTAFITWEKPTVVDNKDKGLEAVQLSGPDQATQKGVNSYSIIYGAYDAVGNKADECEFEVIVKQLRCPRLFPMPYMSLNCTGTRRGSECSFACEKNSQLVGKRSTFCKRNGDDPYSEWIMEFYPYCELSNECTDLTPPENGALSCDTWLGGRFCHPLCSKGYSVRVPLPNFMVCQENGIWTNTDKLSDCFEITSSTRRYAIMSAEFYFSGNCQDSSTQVQIKQKFIEAIKNSESFIVQKACQSPNCNIGNVKVVCRMFIRKRSTHNMRVETEVNFESTNGSLTSQRYETEVHSFTQFVELLEKEFTSHNFTLDIDSGHALLTRITASEFELDCPNNSISVFSDIVACVKCSMGTYFDELSKTCLKCPKGTYQSLIAQRNCMTCPHTTTTGRVGATGSSECENACLPGTWSINGLPPCIGCDIGYYESTYGSTACSKCPGDTITLTEKSDNVFHCVDYDIVFPRGVESSTEIQLNVENLTNSFVISFHIKCKDNCSGTFFKLETSKTVIEMTLDFFGINKQSFGTNLDSKDFGKKWRHIEVHVGLIQSDVYLDGILNMTFNGFMNFTIESSVNVSLGGNGFAGAISQFTINSPISFAKNKQSFVSCKSDLRPSSLINWNAFAYSSLLNSFINIPAKCDDFDNCQIDPCMHGFCTDRLNDYRCECEKGFEGKRCDVNIDDCIAHACQNNASCVDSVQNYTCACNYGYTGKLCEIAMIDGEWSEWENWTECSVSCGNGTILRKRACSDPLPDNGGKYCNGSDTEVARCNMVPCKECEELVAPPNSTLSCETNDNMTGCILECHDGFDFDHDARQNMYCGNETYYEWDFQTDDNPYSRLPYCIETVASEAMHVHHAAFYDMTECNERSSEDIINIIVSRIESVVPQLTCYTSSICSYKETRVLNCNKTRMKRDTQIYTVGFNVTLSCYPDQFGTNICFHGLEDAIEELAMLESEDQLNFSHNSKVHKIIQNSSQSDAELDCPIGTVPYIAYCVPCSYGHYYLNRDCLSCPIGTYQNDVGQVFCRRCPEGWTTEGTDSVSKDDCNVPAIESSTDQDNLGTIIAVCVTVPLIIIIIVIIIACCRQPRLKRKDENLYDPVRHDKDKIITVNNSYFNEYDLDTIKLSVHSPPPVNWSISDDGIPHKITRRECWSSKK